MHRIGAVDYYTFEPARLNDGTICMPFHWFKKDGKMWFRAWHMVKLFDQHQRNGWVIDQANEMTLSEDNLTICGHDLVNGIFLGHDFPSFNSIHGKYFL